MVQPFLFLCPSFSLRTCSGIFFLKILAKLSSSLLLKSILKFSYKQDCESLPGHPEFFISNFIHAFIVENTQSAETLITHNLTSKKSISESHPVLHTCGCLSRDSDFCFSGPQYRLPPRVEASPLPNCHPLLTLPLAFHYKPEPSLMGSYE